MLLKSKYAQEYARQAKGRFFPCRFSHVQVEIKDFFSSFKNIWYLQDTTFTFHTLLPLQLTVLKRSMAYLHCSSCYILSLSPHSPHGTQQLSTIIETLVYSSCVNNILIDTLQGTQLLKELSLSLGKTKYSRESQNKNVIIFSPCPKMRMSRLLI